MSEPIDPDRWELDATPSWRRRFAECDLTALGRAEAPMAGVSAGRMIGGGGGGGGDRAHGENPWAECHQLSDLLALGEPMKEAEAVALVVAVARAWAVDTEGRRPSVDQIVAEMTVSETGVLGQARQEGDSEGCADAGEPDTDAPDAGKPDADQDVTRRLLRLLDQITGNGSVSGELARVRLMMTKQSSDADPAQLAKALEPLAETSLSDWVARCLAASRGIGRVVAPEGPESEELSKLTHSAGIKESEAGGRRQSPHGDSPPARRLGNRPESSAMRESGPRSDWPRRHPWKLWAFAGTVLLGLAGWLAVGLGESPRPTAAQPAAVALAESATPGSAAIEAGPTEDATTPPDAAADRADDQRESASPVHPGGAKSRVTDWAAIVRALDAKRQAALASRDESALRLLHSPGSAALRADLRLIGVLRARHLRPVGLVTDVLRVEAVRLGVDHAVLRVTDQRSAYDLVDDSTGAVREHSGSRPESAWLLTLSRGTQTNEPRGWLISAVIPEPK
ncbi:MAG: hypothetical protein Q8P61_09855 [Candidatus Nanopelagicales bacterium]|nr:hypothetical protein [Candidatus Nanopelagicales bacterium]